MNNYERLQQMNLDEVAAQLTAFAVFIMTKLADKMNSLVGTKTPEISDADKLDIYNIFEEWLKQEE